MLGAGTFGAGEEHTSFVDERVGVALEGGEVAKAQAATVGLAGGRALGDEGACDGIVGAFEPDRELERFVPVDVGGGEVEALAAVTAAVSEEREGNGRWCRAERAGALALGALVGGSAAVKGRTDERKTPGVRDEEGAGGEWSVERAAVACLGRTPHAGERSALQRRNTAAVALT